MASSRSHISATKWQEQRQIAGRARPVKMAENSQPAGTPSMAGQPVLECCNSGINNLFHCRNHIIGNSWLEIDGLEIFVDQQSCNCRSTYSIITRVLYQAVSLDWMVRIALAMLCC
ncbi:hypothetical protein OIU85_017080 [Salix viminalis]|uniref:Uncharacterized protein n=1 Tax=Salix viminalis TaxID=40686 RepID=A0A9Q0V8G3_SALVM|nr:hypothetical protein OIU85_017080 [Salix viminalis]